MLTKVILLFKKGVKSILNQGIRFSPHVSQMQIWSPLCQLELRPALCTVVLTHIRGLTELDLPVEDRQQRMVFVSERERNSEILMSEWWMMRMMQWMLLAVPDTYRP